MQLLLSDIFDHMKLFDTITEADGFYTTQHGTKKQKRTTKVWDICVEWEYGSQAWIKLKDLNNSYPVEFYKHAKGNKIDNDPAFAW